MNHRAKEQDRHRREKAHTERVREKELGEGAHGHPSPDPTQEYFQAMNPTPEAVRHEAGGPDPFECAACRRQMSETAEVCTSCARKLDGTYEDTAPLCK